MVGKEVFLAVLKAALSNKVTYLLPLPVWRWGKELDHKGHWSGYLGGGFFRGIKQKYCIFVPLVVLSDQIKKQFTLLELGFYLPPL